MEEIGLFLLVIISIQKITRKFEDWAYMAPKLSGLSCQSESNECESMMGLKNLNFPDNFCTMMWCNASIR